MHHCGLPLVNKVEYLQPCRRQGHLPFQYMRLQGALWAQALGDGKIWGRPAKQPRSCKTIALTAPAARIPDRLRLQTPFAPGNKNPLVEVVASGARRTQIKFRAWSKIPKALCQPLLMMATAMPLKLTAALSLPGIAVGRSVRVASVHGVSIWQLACGAHQSQCLFPQTSN